MFDAWHVIEAVSLLLAIVALCLGYIHLKEIRGAAESLSTRFIGKFPFFLPDIVDVICSAKESILILCDVPAYGCFSDPHNALAYRQGLERQIQLGRRVELTCLDEERRGRQTTELLSRDDWESWKHENRERPQAFLSAHAHGVDLLTISRDEFIRALNEADEDILRQVFRKDVARLPIDVPIYFWIADERSAIFAIRAMAAGAFEYGFRTSDRALIQGLLDIRRRFRSKFEEASLLRGQTTPPSA